MHATVFYFLRKLEVLKMWTTQHYGVHNTTPAMHGVNAASIIYIYTMVYIYVYVYTMVANTVCMVLTDARMADGYAVRRRWTSCRAYHTWRWT